MGPRILMGVGVILVIVGIALWSLPAAVIFTGLFVAGYSALFVDFKPKAPSA